MLTKNILINLFLVGGGLILGCIVFEIVFHFTSHRFAYIPPMEPKGYLSFDPELGYDITPNFTTATHHFYDYSYDVWSNELGCYDFPYNGETPYIYIAGDSFAWGFTELPEKWTKILEAELGVRTVTCGVSGYGTRQKLIKTRRDLERLPKPELLLVQYFGSNDPTEDTNFPHSIVSDGYRDVAKDRCDLATLTQLSPLTATTTCNVSAPKTTWLWQMIRQTSLNSITISYFYKQIYSSHQVQDSITYIFDFFGQQRKTKPTYLQWRDGINDAVWNNHLVAVDAFAELAKTNGTELLFLLVPSEQLAAATTTTDLPWTNERMKAYLESKSIAYFDLRPGLRERAEGNPGQYYWPHDGHWTIEGNRVVGELVADYLREEGYLK